MLTLPVEIRQKLKSQLLLDEAYKQFPYTDTTGHLTIGIGRNLQSNGISMDEALYLLDNDIMQCEKDLWHYCAFYQNLDNARKSCLVNICFNIGIQSFLGFKNMIAALNAKNYTLAAEEMLNSYWARQVGVRATKLAQIMETGQL
ncbi:MAG: lysozyme [Verrucomicrobia bacterium]|nr:MAG: lysozyme [Verrucomicrobiota bacterium]